MPLRPPQQARSRRTLERMERAAIDLIASGGIDEASVQRIAKKAKSSVGAFYSRFEGKDDLILHLHHRLWGDVWDRWTEALDGDGTESESEAGLPGTLTRLVTALFDALKPDVRPRRLIWARLEASEGPPPGPNPDPEVDGSSAQPGHDTLERILRDASGRIAAHSAEIAHPAPKAGIDVLLRTWLASVPGFALAGTGSTGRPLREIVSPELVRMGQAYLAGSAGPGPDRPEGDGPAQMEFFEVWG